MRTCLCGFSALEVLGGILFGETAGLSPALLTKTRQGLSARRTDLVFEGCVRHNRTDTRPPDLVNKRGGVCAREETRKDRNTKFYSTQACVGKERAII